MLFGFEKTLEIIESPIFDYFYIQQIIINGLESTLFVVKAIFNKICQILGENPNFSKFEEIKAKIKKLKSGVLTSRINSIRFLEAENQINAQDNHKNVISENMVNPHFSEILDENSCHASYILRQIADNLYSDTKSAFSRNFVFQPEIEVLKVNPISKQPFLSFSGCKSVFSQKSTEIPAGAINFGNQRTQIFFATEA